MSGGANVRSPAQNLRLSVGMQSRLSNVLFYDCSTMRSPIRYAIVSSPKYFLPQTSQTQLTLNSLIQRVQKKRER